MSYFKFSGILILVNPLPNKVVTLLFKRSELKRMGDDGKKEWETFLFLKS